jgi:ubiquitin-activating enzyme E1
MPIKQWFYFDALEIVPENLSPEEVTPVGSRYDAQIVIFGKEFQAKVSGNISNMYGKQNMISLLILF